jgi:hypothetical protein
MPYFPEKDSVLIVFSHCYGCLPILFSIRDIRRVRTIYSLSTPTGSGTFLYRVAKLANYLQERVCQLKASPFPV